MSDLSDSVKARWRENTRIWRAANLDRAREISRESSRRYRANNPDADLEYRQQNRERGMLNRARDRAKRRGLPFSLELSDIMIGEECPCCSRSYSEFRPELDRIVPPLGYTKENVIVICCVCNRKKDNSTAEELTTIAEWIYRIREERGLC